MKRIVTQNHLQNLAHNLAESGIPLDLRCGGNGTCGKCRVTLLSGAWEVDGHEVTPPCDALACRTFLLSETGEIEIPETSRAQGSGKILAEWEAEQLPLTPQTVIAIDIGTTTLVAVKIKDGQVVAKASAYNPQSQLGDNVITRIQHASQGKLDILNQMVLDGIQGLLDQVGLDGVERIAVAGNTVMCCLFHKINPESIGYIPFTPPMRVFPARQDLFGGVTVLTVPCIGGYVGGDLTAGMAIVDLQPGEMLIDIGTNCEIIYATQAGFFCTAAAAGPAFEGAGLSCGLRASDGAIDHFFSDGQFSTIGHLAPTGICGSGFVDFLAVQHAQGLINEVGRYEPKSKSFRIADDIVLYEYDIEQLLKAKAAVWAGIKTLENSCGKPAHKIYLAGGFAQYLDLKNAIAIDMLPNRDYEVVGNTSLAGAAKLACTPECMNDLIRLIDVPQEVSLNTLPDFEDNYIDGLLLP